MSHDPQIVLMRFVDDGPVKRRTQLGNRRVLIRQLPESVDLTGNAPVIVEPDFYEVDVLSGQLLNRGAGLAHPS